MPLFDGTALRKLEQLTLIADQVRVGMMKGDRRSRKRGTSIEFADFRNYVRGDDLRRLDWNVYARLERPFIKLLEEEEDLAVHLVVDVSASMDWPEDEAANKLRYALLLAGALGHIGLSSGDQVRVALLTGRGEGLQQWGPYRGNQHSLHLLRFLEQGQAAGVTDLNLSLKQYALRGGRPGLLFLLSDMLSPAGYKEGLSALQARGYEVGLIHILSPDELEPPIGGDLKLVDVETQAEAEITLDGVMIEAYQDRLHEWQSEMADFCSGRGIHFIPINTNEPWEKLVMQTLRVKGIVK